MTYSSIKTIQPQLSRSLYIDNPILRELNFNNDFDFCKRVSVSGISRAITPNAYNDVRDSGDFDYSIAPTKISITSTSDQDKIGGTGLQVLRVEGLNENYVEIMETVVLNGTTGVETSNTFLRVKNTLSLVVGTNKKSVGTITATGGGTTFFKIESTRPITTQLGSYTVPLNHTFILTDLTVIGERNISFNVMQMIRKSEELPEQSRLSILSTDSPYVSYFTAKIPEKTDIFFRSQIETGSGSKTVHVSFGGVLFNNDMLNGL